MEKTSRRGAEKVAGITSPLTKGRRGRERPWVDGVDVYTMWSVHCLSALVSWAYLCVSFMLDA